MRLIVDARFEDTDIASAHSWVKDFESAFEELNRLVQQHWTLTSALLVDEGRSLILPIEGIDGTPLAGELLAREAEWNLLLTPPPEHPRIFRPGTSSSTPTTPAC
ncbi:hypothetical protein [Spirosoma sp. KNUC1025]|uniref:hypothetical protein n=1 Tax=Spirosoma sp. KNUC1025 TaxID=2894082 RepID=UPI001E4A25A7|nr:hypothetical protein [Spirosoma sp. KNUC1025]UFH57739.1 hypothetical protein LN737_32455 [Spirosoma sp. KNUC1025]